MTRITAERPLLPSILDRLLDDDPHATPETPKSRTQVLRELKQSVRRDLERLLNTRWRPVRLPTDLPELETSLVNYGIPDITAVEFGSADSRRAFGHTLEAVIRRYEPRFKSVRVELLDNAEPLDRKLRFRIDALLHAEPAPEPVIFDSALEPASGSIEVRGVRP